MNNSIMGPTWVGRQPVPLSPLSQRLVKQAGSFDAAAAMLRPKQPQGVGAMPPEPGGGALRSPFPFTPKPLDSTAMSYMKGAHRIWDSPTQRAGWALANSPFGQSGNVPAGVANSMKHNFGL